MFFGIPGSQMTGVCGELPRRTIEPMGVVRSTELMYDGYHLGSPDEHHEKADVQQDSVRVKP
jgi:hypothetical protein